MGVPEVKQDHAWCPHCVPGRVEGACSIYDARPDRCRDFHCQWLIDKQFPEYWFPARSKIVVDHRVEGEIAVVCFVVDPTYPDRWRTDPWFSDIKKIARSGLAGVGGKTWTTVVLVKGERILIGR